MGRSDATIRRCWQEWMNNGRFQRHDGSSRHTATADREDRLIVRSAAAAPDSVINHLTCDPHTSVNHDRSQMANRAKFTLVPSTAPPAIHTCRAKLQWCLARPGWNHANWGRMVFSDEYRFQLCPDDHRRCVWRRPGQRADPAFTIARSTCPQPNDIVWGAISFDS
ncbi:HTH_Tnp_Tc3_2 domain-containing protein [Trichonephila clavipes]|nr:HTH_Tnp_Tc3_2 domain-containing protein [Trichonephila clavipes]